MTVNEPRDHPYAPQFFLRNFAVDTARNHIATVAKDGPMAIWTERPIKGHGYERDFYVHMHRGVPVAVETDINRRIETPISQSDTWAKIVSGQTDALDQSDKPILYALIRHLEVRTPHYQATLEELVQMSANPDSDIPFTDEEHSHNALLRINQDSAKAMLNHMAATIAWTANSFRGACLMIYRSPISLRSSTVPVLSIPAPAHPAMELPLPGVTPYQLVLTLNPTTVACLILGDFDGAFSNRTIDQETALGFNRYFLGQFAKFDHVRHLITGRENLAADMTWASYDLVKDSERKITFRRPESWAV
jgi:hypothetical protein